MPVVHVPRNYETRNKAKQIPTYIRFPPMLGQPCSHVWGGDQTVFQSHQDFTNTLRDKDKMFSQYLNI